MDKNILKKKLIRNIDWILVIILTIIGIVGNYLFINFYRDYNNTFNDFIISAQWVVLKAAIFYRFCVLIYDLIVIKQGLLKLRSMFINIFIMCLNIFIDIVSLIINLDMNGAFDKREVVAFFILML